MTVAKIIVRDEVNVSIKNLDLDTRKTLYNKFKFDLPHARFSTAYKLGRWDGTVSYFQLGGSTYINLLPEIMTILEQRNFTFELDDQRIYNRTFSFDKITADKFKHICWPDRHDKSGDPIILRDYQVEIINQFLSNSQSLQEIATGAGKTIITASLSESIEKYGRSLVIVPNQNLVMQTEEDYQNLDLDVGVFYGNRKDYGHKHTICTWQSLNVLFKKTNDGTAYIPIEDFLKDVVCIMVDEVHVAKADVLKKLLSGPFAHIPIRWGLTGTIPKEKTEYMPIKVSIGETVGKKSAKELQDLGVLAKCEVNIKQLIDHGDYANYQSEIKYLVTNSDRIEYISNFIANISDSGNTLILVSRVDTGKKLVDNLGPDNAVFINGSTKVDDRKEHYDEVANVDDKIIIATYGVAAVGINIPRIFNLVLFEPGKSFVRVIQSIGRGIRKAKDKEFVKIWDLTSTCKFSKRHLTERKKYYKEAEYPFKIEKIDWQQKDLFDK